MAMPALNEPAFIMNSRLCAGDSSYKAASTRSADSRSTSPGSSSLPSPSSGPSPAPSAAEDKVQCGGLPTYDYPVPLFVHNTFIETGVPQPLSLMEFFEERRVHSSPVEAPPGLGYEDVAATLPRGRLPLTATGGAVNSAVAAAASASAAAAAATRCLMRGRVPRDSSSPGVRQPVCNVPMQLPMYLDATTADVTPSPWSPVAQQPVFNLPAPPAHPAGFAAGVMPRASSPGAQKPILKLRLSEEVSPGCAVVSSPPAILRLADAIAEHPTDLAAIPTLGSASHSLGHCKPCAFYHSKGCENGTECPYCHTCPPGEKKRRQKGKAVLLREMKRMGLMPEA